MIYTSMFDSYWVGFSLGFKGMPSYVLRSRQSAWTLGVTIL